MVTTAIRGLSRACACIAAAAIVVMMLATGWDILARHLFNQPLHGVVELVEITVLVSTMLGLPEVFLRDEQIQVDLVDHFVGPRLLAAIKAVALILSTAFLVLLATVVWQPMLDARQFGDLKYELGIRVWLLYALILLALVVSVLASGLRLWQAMTGKEVAA